MEDIKTRLGLFRQRCARLAVMQIDIDQLKCKIDKWQRDPPRAPYEPKEVPGGSALNFDDMPRGKVLYGTLEGKEGYDPTIVLRAALEKAEEAALLLEIEKSMIEAALTSLDPKERLVVTQTYMDGNSWQDIVSNIEADYGLSLSQAWIVRTRRESLHKLEKCLEIELKSSMTAK